MIKRSRFSAIIILLCLLITGCATSSEQGQEQKPSEILPEESASEIEPELPSEPTTLPIEITPVEEPEKPFSTEYCQEGQELLYYEDFEDEDAWGWYNIEDTEFNYELVEGRGTVLTMHMPEGYADIFYMDEFENAVWLIDLRAGNPPVNLSLNWHYQRDDGKRMYYTHFAPGGYLQIHIAAPGLHEAQSGLVESADPLPPRKPGDWQHFAFAYFDGRVDLWMGDDFIAGEQHADPIEYGGFGIRFGDYPEAISIDNVVVCSLDEPYKPQ